MVYSIPTGLDDPLSGFEAVEKMRVFRDNDDALVSFYEHAVIDRQQINHGGQTHPAVAATGIRARVLITGHQDQVTFPFYFAPVSSPNQYWALVRFVPGGANLDTPLNDSGSPITNPAPWTVSAFDVSSLAPGVYWAEIYAGTGSSISFIGRIPSGRSVVELPIDADAVNRYWFDFYGSNDWTESPSSELLDATLSVGKGFKESIAQAMYDRDQKLRTRPGGSPVFAEKTGTAQHPAFDQLGDLGVVYVPRWADVLHTEVEGKTDAGQLGRINIQEKGTFFHTQEHSLIAFPQSSAYTLLTCETHLGRFRGREATLNLWVNQANASGTVFARRTANLAAYWTPSPITGEQPHTAPYRSWPADSRSEGGLAHAGWWRRVRLTDRDLLERQWYQRLMSVPVPVLNTLKNGAGYAFDSMHTFRQPDGLGLEGGRIFATIILSGFGSGTVDARLDYTDVDLAPGFPGDHGESLLGIGNGTHVITLPVDVAKDGTDVTIGLRVEPVGGSSGTMSCDDFNSGRMSARVPNP